MTKSALNAMYLNSCGNIRRLFPLEMLAMCTPDAAHQHYLPAYQMMERKKCRTRGAS